jgi:hypothetical protein
MNLRSAARALGGELHADGSMLCPGPGHKRDDRSMSVRFVDGDNFTVNSFANDDWQVCKDHVRSVLGLAAFDGDSEKRLQEARQQRERQQRTTGRANLSEAASNLWDGGQDPRGTPAQHEYLTPRGIELPEHVCYRVLRFHRAVPFRDEATGVLRKAPALIARFTPIVGDDEKPVTAIHRIELLGGGKHGVKKMLGSVAGQTIKLDPDEDVTMGLAIGEGIETTMAFSQVMQWRPVWAMGSVGAIARFPVLSGIDALTVIVDHDASMAGQQAAMEARKRWHRGVPDKVGGRDFYWHMPVKLGQDFVDVLDQVRQGLRLDDLVLTSG